MVAALGKPGMGDDPGKHRKTPALSHWSKKHLGHARPVTVLAVRTKWVVLGLMANGNGGEKGVAHRFEDLHFRGTLFVVIAQGKGHFRKATAHAVKFIQ